MSIPSFSEVRLRAPAKINLLLEVTDRRGDGYHEIDSIFVPIDLADEVVVRPGPGATGTLRIECDDPGVPLDGHNTVARAVEAFYAGHGPAPDLVIALSKKIPSGAGLGGGSSDAAAVLHALARLHDAAADETRLVTAARRVGADVPFFLRPAAARVRGIGERIEPLPWLRWPEWLVIAWPGFAVSTTWAYRELDRALTWPRPADRIRRFLSEPGRFREIHNDFEEIVGEKHPRILELKNRLRALGAETAGLSGSGSAVFGVFADPETAQAAERGVRAEGFWARRTRRLQDEAQ